jgi:hypothetical protein
MTAIVILSEIGSDMSVFPSSKNLISWAGCYLKPLLVQVANALIKSKKHPEFKERYHRIKSHRVAGISGKYFVQNGFNWWYGWYDWGQDCL